MSAATMHMADAKPASCGVQWAFRPLVLGPLREASSELGPNGQKSRRPREPGHGADVVRWEAPDNAGKTNLGLHAVRNRPWHFA